MALVMARWEARLVTGGCSRAVFSQAKGDYQAQIHLDHGSRDSQTGGWTSCLVAKDAQMRVEKKLYAAKGPNRKQANGQPKNKSLLTLSHAKMKKRDVEVNDVDE